MGTGITQNPTNAQVLAQQGTIRVGAELDAFQNDDYLWSSGLNERDFEALVLYKFKGKDGHYFLHTFMRWFGARSFAGYQQDHEWFEQGKTRNGTTAVTIVSGVGTDTLVFESDRTEAYHQVNEVLNTTNGVQVYITLVDDTSGTEQISVKKVDATVFAAGDIQAGQFLGHSHNNWGEKTGQPNGKRWRPTRYQNKYGIVKATAENSGDARTTKTELDLPGGAMTYVTENEYNTMLEFLVDRENMLAWSQESPVGDAITRPRGIFRDIEVNSTVNTTYVGNVTEADYQAQIIQFDSTVDHKEFTAFAGQTFWFDTQNALKDYFLDGGVQYGQFATNRSLAVGIGVNQYKFGNHIINFVPYRGLDNTDVTGIPIAGATATDTDYKNLAFFINMGDDAGFDREGRSRIPYLSYKYKALGNVNRSLVVGFEKGMTGLGSSIRNAGIEIPQKELAALGLGNQVSNDLDCDRFYLLSQISPRLACVDTAHGFMRAIG